MQFRHEVKHEISYHDMLVLRHMLKAVMKSDTHAANGQYEIRSLYFDNLDDKVLIQKIEGANVREKYRLRMYNHDPSVIHLERKFKRGGLGIKDVAALTPEQAQAIINGDTGWMSQSRNEVILGFYTRVKNEGLRAKTIVDYTREPFVYPYGNVRVTLDHNIRTCLGGTDFFDPNCVSIPIKDSPCILEVKWDNYLPDAVRHAIQLDSRHSTAFSKYAACRMYD